jgi:cell wall-associated NlpC family hydrolase
MSRAAPVGPRLGAAAVRLRASAATSARLVVAMLALGAASAMADIAPPAAVDGPDRSVAASGMLAAIDGEGEFAGGYAARAQDLISLGMDYLGIRYRLGGTRPETGLDCSGLVQNVFRNALGLDLPRTAREMARMGNKIGYQDLKPGDLVFFNTMRRAFSHVGIYVGEGRFLHAPASGGAVRLEQIDKGYWTRRFNGARRLLPEMEASRRLPE